MPGLSIEVHQTSCSLSCDAICHPSAPNSFLYQSRTLCSRGGQVLSFSFSITPPSGPDWLDLLQSVFPTLQFKKHNSAGRSASLQSNSTSWWLQETIVWTVTDAAAKSCTLLFEYYLKGHTFSSKGSKHLYFHGCNHDLSPQNSRWHRSIPFHEWWKLSLSLFSNAENFFHSPISLVSRDFAPLTSLPRGGVTRISQVTIFPAGPSLPNSSFLRYTLLWGVK